MWYLTTRNVMEEGKLSGSEEAHRVLTKVSGVGLAKIQVPTLSDYRGLRLLVAEECGSLFV